ncbi:MAG TPA: PQQ-binding-like beta-propeller repeat protein [Steroidobacteraceae bacterium]
MNQKILIASTALLALLASCGGGGGYGGGQMPAAVAPTITVQPANQQVIVGQTASFSVTATGTAPLSYQWQKGGTAIAGATAATYTTPAAAASDNNTVFAVVVSNQAGQLTSNNATLSVASGPGGPAGTDVTTYKNDLNRSGQNLSETTLTTTNVASATFGLLRNLMVDGKVDAQPLYLSQLKVAAGTFNTVFVATEHDSVYAFDSNSGAVIWQVSLLGSGETTSDTRGCSQVVPEIGITSTPVIDRGAGAHGTMFVIAMSKDASSNYHQRLHALDVTTGAELLNGPVEIAATFASASGSMSTFNAGDYEERAALLLSNGTIYTSWTSHCDIAPYAGWIIAFNETSLARSAVLNVAAGSSGGPAIWMAGGGPAVDAAGNIYLLTANGAFETTLDANGFPNKQDYGNSFLKISSAGAGLAVMDYFTMSNEVQESNGDQDLGSGGGMLLPDMTDSANNVRHLMVGAGKDSNIYVVDRDSMGKFNANTNNNYQTLSGSLPGGIWSTPAYFNGTVYYGDVSGNLKAFKVTSAKLVATPTSQSATQFAYPGTAPSVSANGMANGIVWAHENNSAAVLHAYDASNLSHELYNSTQAAGNRDQFGSGNKYITPTIADGKVFVGTTNSVGVFGLLP